MPEEAAARWAMGDTLSSCGAADAAPHDAQMRGSWPRSEYLDPESGAKYPLDDP
eukprot:SAG31_NODE_17924_length_652_cov_1.036101_1_plen_53_part_10